MKITLVKGIGFIINLVWTGWGQGPAEGTASSLPSLLAVTSCIRVPNRGGPSREQEKGPEGKSEANSHQT